MSNIRYTSYGTPQRIPVMRASSPPPIIYTPSQAKKLSYSPAPMDNPTEKKNPIQIEQQLEIEDVKQQYYMTMAKVAELEKENSNLQNEINFWKNKTQVAEEERHK
jgi:hypothetical protein